LKSIQTSIPQAGTLAFLGLCALLAGSVAAQTASQTGPHFIHGSWVNVREAGEAGARATDQLLTNTPVNVLARLDNWCQISYGVGKTGFVACNLLGTRALTLAQTAKEPARAFWIAPSPNRLAAYGQSLLPPAHLRLEVLKKTFKYGDEVRYPAVAEFEAAKKIMKAGMLLNPANEISRGAVVDMAKEMRPYGFKLQPVRPSLFRTHESVALVSEADADGLAAVAGSQVSLQALGLPTAWHGHHDGPEIEGFNGFWDVGSAVLGFAPPLVIYSVAANGLVGASAIRKLPFEVGGEGHTCGAAYLGKSLPLVHYLERSEKVDNFEYDLVRGYPTLKEGTEVLVSFAVPQPFVRQSVKIKVQSQVLNRLPKNEGEVDAAKLKELNPKVILREIDLDGDGVADVMQLETPVFFGEISAGLMLHRSWFVNINGQWFKAGDWEDKDCT
jgi:hypothetical protein